MANGKYISYLRVSTDRQGRSGLGLEAQRQAITDYLNGGHWELLKEFIEVESGKDSDRPQLKASMVACKRTGATLLIAKLDRLSRNVAFIANLMDSGVEFVACDFPTANRLTIHILAAMAEHEREMISKRTKEALKAAKARGVVLGNPKNLDRESAQRGRIQGVQVRQKQADHFSQQSYGIIKGYLDQGMSLQETARRLNADCVLTARGKSGAWTATAVKNVIQRAKQ